MSAKWWVPAPFALVLLATHVHADPIFSFGGGFADDRTFANREDQIPVGWIGFRMPMQEHWSGFLRVSYARVSAPVLPEVADFVASDDAESRVTYVPITLGLRWSAGRRLATQAFAEIGSSVTWGIFEADRAVYNPYGPLQHEVVQEEHWLAGIQLGAGMHHSIDGTVGIEWGVRFDQWAAPPRGWATTGVETNGLRRLALVAGLTLTPSPKDLLATPR
jgi:hypothetical protein